MTDATPEELIELMRRTVGSWPPDRVHRAGFELWVGQPDECSRRRRAHARSILVAETLLSEVCERSEQPVMLMKGLEVAQVYPSPTYRPFRDVDVLIPEPIPLWHDLVSRGFRQNPRRRFDIDHHHLPALVSPYGDVGIELHHRPNVPRWGHIPTDLILKTAEPSRTGIVGLHRPRDDIHALLMAMHCWKGGFVRVRDLFDAVLLASVSPIPVSKTAQSLGLHRFWTWTVRLAESELFETSTRATRTLTRVLLPPVRTRSQSKRSRLLAPYLVRGPLRVTRSHVADYRLGRAARQIELDRGERVCV
jgi:Uncharacterised nucleotidyltransferase